MEATSLLYGCLLVLCGACAAVVYCEWRVPSIIKQQWHKQPLSQHFGVQVASPPASSTALSQQSPCSMAPGEASSQDTMEAPGCSINSSVDSAMGLLTSIAHLSTPARVEARGMCGPATANRVTPRPRSSFHDIMSAALRLGRNDKQGKLESCGYSKSSTCLVLWACKEDEVLRLHRVLPASRYRILTAHTSEQLLQLLDKQPCLPDVLLLDLDMAASAAAAGVGASNGVALTMLDAVRVEYSITQLPVITLLGSSQPHETGIRALAAGANDHMRKPLDPCELEARIHTQVQLRQRYLLHAEAATFLQLLNSSVPPALMQRTMVAHATHPQTCIAHLLSEVTVMFMRVHNLPSLTASWSTQHAIKVLNELMQPFDELVACHGCHKVDAILGTATVIAGHDGAIDHAVRVMRVAQAMLVHAAATFCGERLQVGIGVHTGPLHSGVLGHTMPRFTVFGDTLETAVCIQSKAVPGCTLLSAAAMQCLKQQQAGHQTTGQQQTVGQEFSCVDVGLCHTKGQGPINVYLAKIANWEMALRNIQAADIFHTPTSLPSQPPIKHHGGGGNASQTPQGASHDSSSRPMFQDMQAGSISPAGWHQHEEVENRVPGNVLAPLELPAGLADPRLGYAAGNTAAAAAAVSCSTASIQAAASSQSVSTELSSVASQQSATRKTLNFSNRVLRGLPPLDEMMPHNQQDSAILRGSVPPPATSRTPSASTAGSPAAGSGTHSSSCNSPAVSAKGQALRHTLGIGSYSGTEDGRTSLAVAMAAGVIMERTSDLDMERSHPSAVRPRTAALVPAGKSGPASSSSVAADTMQPVHNRTAEHQTTRAVHTRGGLRQHGSLASTNVNSGCVLDSGTLAPNYAMNRTLLHTTSSGVTLPMSSDSSLYRMPWYEQYIAGQTSYLASTATSERTHVTRRESEEALERVLLPEIRPGLHTNMMMTMEGRFSTQLTGEMSSRLDANSNNLLPMDSLLSSNGGIPQYGSNNNSSRRLLTGLSSSTLAAMHASLLATAKSASGQGSSLLSQLSSALLHMLTNSPASPGKPEGAFQAMSQLGPIALAVASNTSQSGAGHAANFNALMTTQDLDTSNRPTPATPAASPHATAPVSPALEAWPKPGSKPLSPSMVHASPAGSEAHGACSNILAGKHANVTGSANIIGTAGSASTPSMGDTTQVGTSTAVATNELHPEAMEFIKQLLSVILQQQASATQPVPPSTSTESNQGSTKAATSTAADQTDIAATTTVSTQAHTRISLDTLPGPAKPIDTCSVASLIQPDARIPAAAAGEDSVAWLAKHWPAASASVSFPCLVQNLDQSTGLLQTLGAQFNQSRAGADQPGTHGDHDLLTADESAGLLLLGLATLSNGPQSDQVSTLAAMDIRRMLLAFCSHGGAQAHASGSHPPHIPLQQLVHALSSVTNTSTSQLPQKQAALTGTGPGFWSSITGLDGLLVSQPAQQPSASASLPADKPFDDGDVSSGDGALHDKYDGPLSVVLEEPWLSQGHSLTSKCVTGAANSTAYCSSQQDLQAAGSPGGDAGQDQAADGAPAGTQGDDFKAVQARCKSMTADSMAGDCGADGAMLQTPAWPASPPHTTQLHKRLSAADRRAAPFSMIGLQPRTSLHQPAPPCVGDLGQAKSVKESSGKQRRLRYLLEPEIQAEDLLPPDKSPAVTACMNHPECSGSSFAGTSGPSSFAKLGERFRVRAGTDTGICANSMWGGPSDGPDAIHSHGSSLPGVLHGNGTTPTLADEICGGRFACAGVLDAPSAGSLSQLGRRRSQQADVTSLTPRSSSASSDIIKAAGRFSLLPFGRKRMSEAAVPTLAPERPLGKETSGFRRFARGLRKVLSNSSRRASIWDASASAYPSKNKATEPPPTRQKTWNT